MKVKNGISLYKNAKKIIPGGTTLFSKRSELHLPNKWPSYFTKAKKINVPIEKVRSAMEAQVPMQRIGRAEEYANLVCFLVSEQASYITGTNIPIDGGLLKSF